jgi:hypothetical protein
MGTVTITRHVALVDASGQPHIVNWGLPMTESERLPKADCMEVQQPPVAACKPAIISQPPVHGG